MSSFLKTHKTVSFLASGSFGLVYITHKENESPSATKFLFCETNNNTRCLELIRREINLHLIHENVVQVLDTSEEFFNTKDIHELRSLLSKPRDRRSWNFLTKYYLEAIEASRVKVFILKMEQCGRTLRTWLNRHNSNPELYRAQNEFITAQLRIISDGANGLCFLHNNKIIHRDIKPENIMFSLGQKDEFTFPIKIGDFGLSREIPTNNASTSQVKMTSNIGTDSYMAPEVQFGKYSQTADIYSFGLVMWEVLQLLDEFDRQEYFNRRVNNNDNHLIRKDLALPNAKYFIMRMTANQVDHRMKSLDHFIGNKVHFAHDSEQLTACLRNAAEEEIIYLDEARYEGAFEVIQDKLTLQGMGDPTFFRPATYRTTNQTKDSPTCSTGEKFILSIHGSHCSINGLQLESFDPNQSGVAVFGNHNQISNISLIVKEGAAINIYGDGNTVKNLKIKNSRTGITVLGKDNKVDYNYMQNGEEGISLGGIANEVTTFCWSNLEIGVSIREGSRSHRVVDIKEIDKHEGGSIGLKFEEDTAHCSVTNVKAEEVSVAGRNHSLTNIRTEKKTKISGTGHSFTDCEGM